VITTCNAIPVDSERATVRILPSTTLSLDGTRMPSAALGHKAVAGADSAFDGTYVGSPAWSPPV
jgi:hypothetical protein